MEIVFIVFLFCLLVAIYTIGLRQDKHKPLKERRFYTSPTIDEDMFLSNLENTKEKELKHQQLKSLSNFGILGFFAPPEYFVQSHHDSHLFQATKDHQT